MAAQDQRKMEKAREIVGYNFASNERLWEALSPPGAPGAKTEGNQRLASIGTPTMQTVIKVDTYLDGDSTGVAQDRVTGLASRTALANAFNNSGLEECVNKNPSSTVIGANTAVAVVAALVGLVSLEEDGRVEAVRKAMLKLGIL